jgi:exocyst complex component 4
LVGIARNLKTFYSEDLRKTPEKIDSLVNGRFYLTASRCLVSALKTLHSDEFREIGALDTIRSNLTDFKNVTVHKIHRS